MSASSITTFYALMKEYYVPQDVVLRGYKASKALAMMPKMQKFGGRFVPVPIWHEAGQGVSATFSKAQSRASASSSKRFELTRKKIYGVGELDHDLILATQEGGRDGRAAFLQATQEINALADAVTLDIGFKLYRGQDNVRARIGAIVDNGSTATVTLKVRGDIVGFAINMYVTAADGSAAPTGTLRDSGAAYKITSIDRKAGTILLDGDAVGTSSWSSAGANTPTHVAGASGDWLFRDGDHVSSADNLGISGLTDWLPTTVASSGDSFYGVDRYADRSRLAGIYTDASSATSVREALVDLAMFCREQGVTQPSCTLHPQQFARLIKETDAKIEYDMMVNAGSGSPAKFGFSAFRLDTPAGPVAIVDDPFCPMNEAFMINPATWKLYSMGATPRLLNYEPREGLGWLRIVDEDAVEYRFGAYLNLGCSFPGGNGRVTLPAAS